jgi:hypothetical protein
MSSDIGDSTVWKLIETIKETNIILAGTNAQLENIKDALDGLNDTLLDIKGKLDEKK